MINYLMRRILSRNNIERHTDSGLDFAVGTMTGTSRTIDVTLADGERSETGSRLPKGRFLCYRLAAQSEINVSGLSIVAY